MSISTELRQFMYQLKVVAEYKDSVTLLVLIKFSINKSIYYLNMTHFKLGHGWYGYNFRLLRSRKLKLHCWFRLRKNRNQNCNKVLI